MTGGTCYIVCTYITSSFRTFHTLFLFLTVMFSTFAVRKPLTCNTRVLFSYAGTHSDLEADLNEDFRDKICKTPLTYTNFVISQDCTKLTEKTVLLYKFNISSRSESMDYCLLSIRLSLCVHIHILTD